LVIRKIPEYLWAAVIGTCVAVPLLTFAVPELWRTPAHGAVLFPGVPVVLWLFGAPVVTLAVAPFHFVVVAGYVLLTGPFQENTVRRQLFVHDSWDRCGFGWWTSRNVTFIPVTVILGGGLAVLLFVLLKVLLGDVADFLGLKLRIEAATDFLDVLFSNIFQVVAFIIGASVVIAIGVAAVIDVYKLVRYREFRRSRFSAFRGWVKLRSPRVAKVVSIILAAVVGLTLLKWVFSAFGALLARALAAAILLAVSALLAWQSYRLWQFSFGQPYSFGPKSFTESSWKEALKSADVYEQEYIMAHTTHETLGLDPTEFLNVFQNVQPLIKAEPALSSYWARRADLEQVLKQERRG
jgi:hypothetical protein